MTNPTTPPTSRTSLKHLIAERQSALNLTDVQLATALGYDRSIVIAMIKQGNIKLPLTKVPALATALETDASSLLVLAMKEAAPDLLALIEEVWGPRDLTSEESRLVQACRKIADGRKVAPVVFSDSVVALVTV